MSLEQLWGLGGLLSKLMQLCDTCSVKDPRGIVCVRERHILSVDGDVRFFVSHM